MKLLKTNQRGPWCSYCTGLKTRATHRQDGSSGKFACYNHIDKLREDELRDEKRDNRYTEADHITWGQL